MEGLRQQAITMNSAVGNAEDAVARDQSLRILSRRWAELDQAYDSYKLAFHRYRRVADKDSCATAREARRLILGFWDKAMDELEAHMEVKEMENVGAEQEEEEFSAEEDKEVEEPRIDQVEVEVAARDDVLQGGGAIEPGEGDQSDAKDELECGAAKDDFWQGGRALDPGEGDCEIGAKDGSQMADNESLESVEAAKVKVKVERIDVYNVRAEEFATLEVLRAGQLDPGEVRGNWKEAQWLVQQSEVEKPRIDKVEQEFFDAKDEVSIGAKVLMGTNEVRDPGDGGGQRWKWKDVRWLNVEVKQELDDVWRGASLKLLDLLLHDAELVMLRSGFLRFVMAGCRRTPEASSEYG